MRPVPDVRGNASGNGQPAGAGKFGSARWAAAGAPAGTPVTVVAARAGTVTSPASSDAATTTPSFRMGNAFAVGALDSCLSGRRGTGTGRASRSRGRDRR